MAIYDPAHPGELIRETLDGLCAETRKKLSIEEVAKGLGTTHKTLSAIINGKQSIKPEMAIRLSKAFNTSPEFWLHAQENYDLAQARKSINTHKIKVFWKPNAAV